MKKIFIIMLLFISCKGIDFNYYETESPRHVIYYVSGQSKDLLVSYILYDEIITVSNPELPYEIVLLQEEFNLPFRLEVETFYSRDYLTACINNVCETISGEDSIILTQRIKEK